MVLYGLKEINFNFTPPFHFSKNIIHHAKSGVNTFFIP